MRVRTKDFNSNMRKISKALSDSASVILYESAYDIYKKSQALVPVDTGLLKSTGHISTPRKAAGAYSMEVGYGGGVTGYKFSGTWRHAYVYYANAQNRRVGFLPSASSHKVLFENNTRNLFARFLKSPKNVLVSSLPADPPFTSQTNPVSLQLAEFKSRKKKR